VEKDAVSTQVVSIIREELQEESLAPDAQTRLGTLPGWDSVTMSSILIGIEQEFGFEFSVQEMDGLSDFGSLVSLVQEKIA